MRLVSSLCLCIVGSASLAQEVAPSFDCAKAQSDAEKAICYHSDLAALDLEMVEVYGAARTDPAMTQKDKDQLKASQVGWIKGRNDCWKSHWSMETCVAYSYAVRIADLRRDYAAARDADSGSVGPVLYQCEGREEDIQAVFINIGEQMVVLSWEVVSIVLRQVEAASGVKYTSDDWIDFEAGTEGLSLFWMQGDEAQFQVSGGSTGRCQQI